MTEIHSLPRKPGRRSGVDRKANKYRKYTSQFCSTKPVHFHSVSCSVPPPVFGVTSHLPGATATFSLLEFRTDGCVCIPLGNGERKTRKKGTATGLKSASHLCPPIGSLVPTVHVLLFLFVVLFLVMFCLFPVTALLSRSLLMFDFILF